jgi:putative tricarboxylic transport membrane protein
VRPAPFARLRNAGRSTVGRDLACSLTLLAVSAVYYRLADDIGETALSDAVGAAGVPKVYAAVLAGLAVLIGVGAVLRRPLVPTSAPSDGVSPMLRLLRAAGALAIGVAYVLVVPVIGYPFAIALAIAAMAIYQGERATLRLSFVACAGAATLFVLFDLVLGIEMPAPWNG